MEEITLRIRVEISPEDRDLIAWLRQLAAPPVERVIIPAPDPVLPETKDPDPESVPLPEQPTACLDCGKPIASFRRRGRGFRCHSCAQKKAKADKKAGLPPPPACRTCGKTLRRDSVSGLCGIHWREKKVQAMSALGVRPFCVHDRDPETCLHCARARENGIVLERPRRDRREDLDPKRRPMRPILDPDEAETPDLVEAMEGKDEW